MKLSRVFAVAFLAWLAWKGYQTMRAVESSKVLRPRDPYAPVN